jgi:hypothetical protein
LDLTAISSGNELAQGHAASCACPLQVIECFAVFRWSGEITQWHAYLAHGLNGSLVHEVHDVGAGETRSGAGNALEGNAWCHLLTARVHRIDLLPPLHTQSTEVMQMA